jgi:hypothetical protein
MGITRISGFTRKFTLTEDVQAPSYSTSSKGGSSMSHKRLYAVGADDHHKKNHADTHNEKGSDPIRLPFSFKNSKGQRVAKIDDNGNLLLRGRVLKLSD